MRERSKLRLGYACFWLMRALSLLRVWAFHKDGVNWLRSLNLESVKCYLHVMDVLNFEIRHLSLELRRMAGIDDDVRLPMTITRIGYYTGFAKAEIGDVNHFKSGERLQPLYCTRMKA